MPGRAKSAAAKHRAALHNTQILQERAVATYNEELERYIKQGGKKPTYRGVAARFGLNHRLLRRRVLDLGTSKATSNATKSHLTEAEATNLIDFAIEMARRAFPLRVKELEKHTTEIVRTRKPDFKGVGKNWAPRFLIKHGKRISTKWGVSLDTVHAKTVTPAAVEHYFNMLHETLEKYNIQPHNLYGFDETGFALGCGKKTRVLASASETTQKMQRDGNKEGVTVMSTICADGSNVPPVVIFKGQYFLEKWRQNNPIGAA